MNDRTGYFDESGRELTPDEVAALGADVEIVEEAVEAPHRSRVPRGLIAGVLVVVLVAGAAVVFALSKLGEADTLEDATAAASSVVTTATRDITDRVQGRTRPGLVACGTSDLKRARWIRGDDTPVAQLRVLESVALPPVLVERAAASTSSARTLSVRQLRDRSLSVVHHDRRARGDDAKWWAVTVDTMPTLTVVGEAEAEDSGEDSEAATACPSVDGGVYRIVGDGIPDQTREMQTDLVQVSALKGDGVEPTTVWIVTGDRLLKTVLEYTPSK
ncbi:hypothetical protein ACFUEJ_10700 [Gordonia sp. NPDC057258]|uniref:hypothetical protein n=1 Tax=unclassified Gordonia (in: high G+C Gram-positive bacteria) TaxID=2657482 RepID=UPI003628443F